MLDQNKVIPHSVTKLIKECPVCKTKYRVSQAKVIELTDLGFLLHFSCFVCQSSLIAQIIEMPFGLVGSAMLTDLEAQEVAKFKNGQPVSVDDVLEVYKKLETRN